MISVSRQTHDIQKGKAAIRAKNNWKWLCKDVHWEAQKQIILLHISMGGM
jgi:hypothetical protein